MLDVLAHRWWAVAVRGVAAVLFGLLALFWPGLTLLVLIVLVGAYALVDGILLLVHAFVRGPVGAPRRLVVLLGSVSVLLGVLVLVWPGLSALLLALLVGLWALVSGVAQIVAGFMLRREAPDEWRAVLNGALSVLFGLVMVFAPGAGALALVWLIAAYTIVTGVVLIVLSLRLRSFLSASSP